MKRILIIEDDLVVGNIYQRRFEMAGYDVEYAPDGKTGLEKVLDTMPDVVQVDLQLPDISGIEVIKRIRENPKFKTLPILVISSLYKPGSARDAWKAGASRCVSKLECSPQLALEIISELLSPPPPKAPPQAPAPYPSPFPVQIAGVSAAVQGSTAGVPAGSVPVLVPMAVAAQAPAHPSTADIRKEFLDRTDEIRRDLRNRVNSLIKSRGIVEQLLSLKEFHKSTHSLADLAAVTGLHRISHLAEAMEILLKELHDKPARITGSTLRTIAFASDALSSLCLDASKGISNIPVSGLILTVDDEPIARRVLTNALAKVNLKNISLDDPLLALKILRENQFDLIFLDADMPGMSGFDLCKEIRTQAQNKSTPVIFVTSLLDFESRAQSSLSGGNDLIAKPFLMMELAVKALTYLMKPKPGKERHATPPSNTSEPPK